MKTLFFYLTFLILLLAACTGGGGPPEMAVGEALLPTPTLEPTPTLLSALATLQPTTRLAGEMAVGATAVGTTAVADSTLKSATAKPTPTLTPTPSPTPTPTPQPAQRIALGDAHLHNGDYAAAITQLDAALRLRASLSDAQVEETLYNLGVAYLRSGQPALAANAFAELLGVSSGGANTAAYFHLGQAQTTLGDHRAAIGAYQSYLDANPEMATYVNPYIADAYFALGERAQGVAAYEAALSGAGFRLAQIELRQRLADFYLADADYAAAVAQYDAIHDLAVTELTKGQMTYLAGTAELRAGNLEAAYARYLFGFNTYPRAYESYLGLVTLVEAGQPVDEFQRGLVDYYAKAYFPAIAAFDRYLAANPQTARADTQLYLAWCYEGVGNVDAALAALDAYALRDAAAATIERAKLLARAGNGAEAITAYEAYLANFPDGPDAPFAAWWAAQWRERQGDIAGAMAGYRLLAQNYSWHEDAPEALFRVGLLAEESGDRETAVATWLALNTAYPASEVSGATLVWLLRTLPAQSPTPFTPTRIAPDGTPLATTTLTGTQMVTDTAVLLTQVQTMARNNPGAGYYALRAREMVNGGVPFTPTARGDLSANQARLQVEAETWLREWLGLAADADVHTLSPTLTADARLIVGGKLWELGLFEAAKRELEALRAAYADNALFSYQLALYFRDIGLYRSSIIAADTVRSLSGQSLFDLPRFIGQLIYPAYYADLILPLADEYGYDPLLQLALVRQESLFESIARSGAAAQGLSQVIPDTGVYIAQQLNWPDFVNEDLYKPYVGLNFGAFYLAQQLTLFDNFVPAALSAYNAGPGNALRWYNLAGPDHDLYLETVNFNETHTYIERIYVGYVAYQYLYGNRE